jgi:MYXO-CTERM domain-containing protein
VYLMNDASDLLGGPALTTLGGDFTTQAGRYSFGANQGLSLENAVNASVYTIDFVFNFDLVSGYRRLIDFKALTSDTGLYNYGSQLKFYNEATGPDSVFAIATDARVTLTRDAAGVLTGYVNGLLQFQFNDTAGLSQFSGANQIAYFFRDDNAVSGEASAGSIDYLRIYDTALSANEVANLTSPVPEPATGLLALAGIGLFALLRRRRT